MCLCVSLSRKAIGALDPSAVPCSPIGADGIYWSSILPTQAASSNSMGGVHSPCVGRQGHDGRRRGATSRYMSGLVQQPVSHDDGMSQVEDEDTVGRKSIDSSDERGDTDTIPKSKATSI